MDSTDSVAIVTGASAGIGEATARALAADGYAVTLAARREDRLRDIAADIESEHPDAETLVAPTDVSDEDAVAAMVDATVDAFGRLDALVNNAGVLRSNPVLDADPEDVSQQVEVNLLGSMHATRAALPALVESGGDVIGVSSMNATHPAEGGSAYTASKAGVNGFYDSLRKEMREEAVRVTILMPGPVESEMNDWAEWDGRPLAPSDVADTVTFVLSRPDRVELPRLTVNTTDKLA